MSQTKHNGWKIYRPTYQSWSDMKQRCENPKHPSFHNYGGRGIFVCKRWAESFSAFLSDMGPMPKGFSIERIDVNGNYEPMNCKWASRSEQQANRRDCRKITNDGKTLCIAEWSRLTGIHEETIRSRLRAGLSASVALSQKKFHFGSTKAINAMKGK